MSYRKIRDMRDKFFKKFIETTPLLSNLDIQYQQEYSGKYENLSIYDSNCAVCAAIKGGRISGFGRPVMIFGTDKAQKEQAKRLYEISPDIYYLDYLEGGRLSAVSKFLLQRGLTAKPYYTQIIDLTKSVTELHADLRKSYKSIINAGHPKELFADAVPDYHKMHARIHKRETRNQATWDLQKEMMLSGNAFIIGLFEANKPVGYTLFYHNFHSCYYAGSVSEENSNTHSAIWYAIFHAQSLGIKSLERGEQIYSGKEKDISISQFKAGMGGDTKVRLLFGEKHAI